MYELSYLDDVPWMALFFTDINRKSQSMTIGAFLQDTWTPSRSLTINLGLRYDYIRGIFPKQLMPGSSAEYMYAETEYPISWHTLSPRLGISYSPFKDGRTVIKAGYGRYVAPLNLDYISYAMKGGFFYFLSMLNPDYSEDYRITFASTGDILFDPESKAPYGDEINLGVQRELFADFAVSVTYMQKWEKRLLQRMDVNGLDVELLKSTGQTDWFGYHLVDGIDPMTGQTAQFYEQNEDKGPIVYYHTNVPGTARTYKGLEIKFTKRMSRNWSMIASYVYSKGEGIISTTYDDTWTTTRLYVEPNFTEFYRSGKLEHQRPHYFKLQGTYLAPWGFSISANFQYFSGDPFTRTLRSLEAGLSLYQGSATKNAEPRGSSETPSNYLLDLSIQKVFSLGFGSLTLIADAFNVFNSNKVTSYGALTEVNYMTTLAITPPRFLRLGVAFQF
jgi:outer membrane receptor protein involved in Fe transport